MDESEVLEWMVDQKNDESIEEIDRDQLFKYIETKEFLAVVFCKYYNLGIYSNKITLHSTSWLVFDKEIDFQIKKKIQTVQRFSDTLN